MRLFVTAIFFLFVQISYSQEKDDSLQLLTAVRKNFSDTISENGNLLQYNSGDFHSYLNPAFDFLIGQAEDSKLQYGLGFDAQLRYKKWAFGTTFLAKEGEYLPYQEEFVREHNVLPAMGVTRGIHHIRANYKSAFVNYKANDIFSFELGYGRNFIGEGYRSLFLSDFGNASPYFKIQTTFWNIQYTNIFAAQQDIYGVEGAPDLYRTKYTASHFLEWEIWTWLSLGLFETVIWDASHSSHQGFDVNYLNPVIFYRPIEYSIGSSNNVMVGAQLKISPSKSQHFYAQLLLDEFLLKEVQADVQNVLNINPPADYGWWANKYGIQFGWKGSSLFKIHGLDARLEANIVRPYTYAHTNPTQAYSNFNLSLAHPLGANFAEWLAQISYQKKRWKVAIHYSQSYSGHSSAGYNFGDNLELSNNTYLNKYGNFICQGEPKRTNYFNTEVSYILKKSWKCMATVGVLYRENNLLFHHPNQKMVYLKLRTNLFNQYFDF